MKSPVETISRGAVVLGEGAGVMAGPRDSGVGLLSKPSILRIASSSRGWNVGAGLRVVLTNPHPFRGKARQFAMRTAHPALPGASHALISKWQWGQE